MKHVDETRTKTTGKMAVETSSIYLTRNSIP